MALPGIKLVFEPPGPEFILTEDCQMPKVQVTAQPEAVAPAASTSYQWKITLTFTGATCKNSLNRRIEHPTITANTPTNSFTIPFTQVRGVEIQRGRDLIVQM